MGLYQDILRAPVTDLDIRELIAIRPATSVREALRLMRERSLGCAVVVDERGRAVGKFTERVLVQLLLTQEDALDGPVSQHMDEQGCYVRTSDTIAAVLSCMKERGVRFVVVLDDDDRPVGVTGQKGLMAFIADHFPRQVKVQRMRSVVSMDEREGA